MTFTDSQSWTPTAPGLGELNLEIGEAAGAPTQAATVALPSASQAPSPLRLQVSLTGGATFGDQGQPAGCEASGAAITCTFDQPSPRTTVPFRLLVAGVTSPEQTATAEIRRDGKTEPEATLPTPIRLTPYESGLQLAHLAWQTRSDRTGDLVITLSQSEAWPVDGVTVAIGLSDRAVPDPAGVLPAGCTASQGDGEPGITCILTVQPGTVDLRLPLAVHDQGQRADVTVKVGDVDVAPPETIHLHDQG